jgi:hypothetical protein
MRYELADYEWAAIKPMLPNKPRGVPRVNDRRVLNSIFWVLRSGAPWRDLPEAFGPYTTCYNRFVRWRRAGLGPHDRYTCPCPLCRCPEAEVTVLFDHLIGAGENCLGDTQPESPGCFEIDDEIKLYRLLDG